TTIALFGLFLRRNLSTASFSSRGFQLNQISDSSLRDRYLQFPSVIAGLRDATEMAMAIAPETRELNDLLEMMAAEVDKAIDGLLSDLDRRVEALRAEPELPQPLNGSPGLPQNNDRVLHLPEWLPHSKPTKEESAEDRTAAA